MRMLTTVLLASAAMAAPAAAQYGGQYGGQYGQPYYPPASQSGASATFYEQPDFRGRSVTIDRESRNMSSAVFNDRAKSARFEGQWSVCEDSEFRGRCETVSGSVRDLRSIGMEGRISSARQTGGGGGGWDDGPGYPGYPPPGPGPGRPDYPGYPDQGGGGWGDERGVEGRSVVFYAAPRMNGVDMWGTGKVAADGFCRRMGHSSAVYYDITERSSRSQDLNGRFYNNSTVLRDVLCRK